MCTNASHERVKATAWGTLLNPRIWALLPDEPLLVAECPHCMSTLARDATPEDLAQRMAA